VEEIEFFLKHALNKFTRWNMKHIFR